MVGSARVRWPPRWSALHLRGGAAPEDRAYVASEAADAISLVRFGPQGLAVDHTLPTGLMPNDIDGPHGLAVVARRPRLLRVVRARPAVRHGLEVLDPRRQVLGHVTLGMFPATVQVTPDGEFLYVVNFNLHGDHVPSSVSVVATDGLLEVARIPTCLMPHGSRLNPQGTRHYSACMMDDTLVEIDTGTLKVSRHFTVTPGQEAGHPGAPAGQAASPRARGTRRRARQRAAAAGYEDVLADMGAAVRRRPPRVRRLQRLERHRRDRRGVVADGAAPARRARACTTWPSRATGGC